MPSARGVPRACDRGAFAGSAASPSFDATLDGSCLEDGQDGGRLEAGIYRDHGPRRPWEEKGVSTGGDASGIFFYFYMEVSFPKGVIMLQY